MSTSLEVEKEAYNMPRLASFHGSGKVPKLPALIELRNVRNRPRGASHLYQMDFTSKCGEHISISIRTYTDKPLWISITITKICITPTTSLLFGFTGKLKNLFVWSGAEDLYYIMKWVLPDDWLPSQKYLVKASKRAAEVNNATLLASEKKVITEPNLPVISHPNESKEYIIEQARQQLIKLISSVPAMALPSENAIPTLPSEQPSVQTVQGHTERLSGQTPKLAKLHQLLADNAYSILCDDFKVQYFGHYHKIIVSYPKFTIIIHPAGVFEFKNDPYSWCCSCVTMRLNCPQFVTNFHKITGVTI